MRRLLISCATLLCGCFLAAASPIVVTHTSNQGIDPNTFGFNFNSITNTITINQTWTSLGLGSLSFSGLTQSANYIVVINQTNNSGAAWNRFAVELLDPAGQVNDDLDTKPYPSFVPVGFTTSNDNDGLSFAQGSNIPRTSPLWGTVESDELSDVRDFLDFSGGTLGNGQATSVTFGLRDNQAANNQPFLLALRPNQVSRSVAGNSVADIPEPGTWLMLAGGLALVGCLRKRLV